MAQLVLVASVPPCYRKVRCTPPITHPDFLTNLNLGQEAVFLRDRADIIKMRLMAVKSKQCNTMKNKYYCPEIFLDVVASKLTQTAVLFLNVELLSEFYYNFPRELDMRLGRHLSTDEVERFAKEDPKVK